MLELITHIISNIGDFGVGLFLTAAATTIYVGVAIGSIVVTTFDHVFATITIFVAMLAGSFTALTWPRNKERPQWYKEFMPTKVPKRGWVDATD